jgi:hypothetical protein
MGLRKNPSNNESSPTRHDAKQQEANDERQDSKANQPRQEPHTDNHSQTDDDQNSNERGRERRWRLDSALDAKSSGRGGDCCPKLGRIRRGEVGGLSDGAVGE